MGLGPAFFQRGQGMHQMKGFDQRTGIDWLCPAMDKTLGPAPCTALQQHQRQIIGLGAGHCGLHLGQKRGAQILPGGRTRYKHCHPRFGPILRQA